MRTVRSSMMTLAVAAVVFVLQALPAGAALKGVSQSINPVGGFPFWIQDQNSLALQACLEPANCILPLAGEEPQYNPGLALSFPAAVNFPSEHFYFFAESSVPITPNSSGSLVRMVIEGAFLPSIAPNNQNMFHRFRVRLQNPPESGAYTLRHPWGATTFTGQECTAGDICTMTADLNLGIPPAFSGLLGSAPEGTISTFLTQTNPVPANGYIGNPAVAGPVTGGTVRNIVEIVAPSGAVIGTSSDFIIAGKKIGMDVNPSPAAPPVTTLIGTPATIPVVVTNITGAPLAFTAPGALSISGSNAADFTIVAASDTCSGNTIPVPDPLATPAVSGTCSLQVRFDPAASVAAARSASLTITPDNTAVAPPVSVALSGTAQYAVTVATSPTVTATGSRTPGSVSPSGVQAVNAGGSLTLTLTPETGYAPRVEVAGALQTVTGTSFSLSGLSANRTVNLKFVRSGDVVEDGLIKSDDALRALQIALGIGAAATSDERIAADVGPLAASKPKADGAVDVSDVLVILRRAVGLDPAW